jgi:hypothetical protein
VSCGKAVLARHMPNIVLVPNLKDKTYQVASEWDLLPSGSLGYTNGAEGPGATTRRFPFEIDLSSPKTSQRASFVHTGRD